MRGMVTKAVAVLGATGTARSAVAEGVGVVEDVGTFEKLTCYLRERFYLGVPHTLAVTRFPCSKKTPRVECHENMS